MAENRTKREHLPRIFKMLDRPSRACARDLQPVRHLSPSIPASIQPMTPSLSHAEKRPPRRKAHPAITERQARDLQAAFSAASRAGLALNRFVTVQWAFAPPHRGLDAQARMTRIRDREKAWLRRQMPGAPLLWAEVREQSGFAGEHWHRALYTPPSLFAAYSQNLARWVALDSESFQPQAVDVRPIRHWPGLRTYMLKGGTPEVRRAYGVPPRHSKKQGVILGPRLRISHALRALIRDRHDVSRPLDARVHAA